LIPPLRRRVAGKRAIMKMERMKRRRVALDWLTHAFPICAGYERTVAEANISNWSLGSGYVKSESFQLLNLYR
jgi:hypothetical protein